MDADALPRPLDTPEICRAMEVLKMFSQNEMERELYEGRLKEKRDRQMFETQVATAIRERDEARRAMKLALVQRIQLCERLLKQPASDPGELLERSEQNLRELAERLEQELTPSSE